MKKIQYILILGLLFVMASCEKDTLPMNFSPALTTGGASDIFRVGATLSGSIQKSDGVVVKDCGILISELQSMAEYTEIKTSSTENTFDVLAQNLTPGKKYYYCAYASSGYSIARGDIKEFTTTDSNAPVFSELAISGKDEKSFTVATTILDEGGSDLVLCGFCWKSLESSSADPTFEDNVVNVSTQSTAVSARIKDLMPNKQYLVRAYGVNARGLGYGKTITVSTNNATVPAVSSIIPTDSTTLGVSIKASILSSGESAISEIGFCWSSESKEPTINNLKYNATDQLNNANFVFTLDKLAPETTYYIRAYAINTQGTGYGDVYSYTTKKGPGIASLKDLLEFRDAKKAGTNMSKWKDDNGVFNIYADIDISSIANWDPISEIAADEILEGNGHTISGLNITNIGTADDYGFIHLNKGTIRNLHLGKGNIHITTVDNRWVLVGALCGVNFAIISDCSSEVTMKCVRKNVNVHSSIHISGISGGSGKHGSIVRCINRGDITGGGYAAGIIGDNAGLVESCENYGKISALDFNRGVMGISGCFVYAEVVNCKNYGTIVGDTASYVGGITAAVEGVMRYCSNEGNVSGGGSSVGGIAGDLYGNGVLENCLHKGVLTGGDKTYTGGIVGHIKMMCTYNSNMNTGTVNGANGSDSNAIGKDERNANTDIPSIDDLPNHEW